MSSPASLPQTRWPDSMPSKGSAKRRHLAAREAAGLVRLEIWLPATAHAALKKRALAGGESMGTLAGKLVAQVLTRARGGA